MSSNNDYVKWLIMKTHYNHDDVYYIELKLPLDTTGEIVTDYFQCLGKDNNEFSFYNKENKIKIKKVVIKEILDLNTEVKLFKKTKEGDLKLFRHYSITDDCLIFTTDGGANRTRRRKEKRKKKTERALASRNGEPDIKIPPCRRPRPTRRRP